MRPSYNGNDCFDIFHSIKRNDFEAPDDFGEDSFFFHLSKFLPNAISCSSRKGDIGIEVNRSEIKFIIQYSHQVSQDKKHLNSLIVIQESFRHKLVWTGPYPRISMQLAGKCQN